MAQSADDFLGDHPSADDFLGPDPKAKAAPTGPGFKDDGTWGQAAAAVADTARGVVGGILPGAAKAVGHLGSYLAAPLEGETGLAYGDTTKAWNKKIDDFVDEHTPSWLGPSTKAGQENLEAAGKVMGAVGSAVRSVPGGNAVADVGGDVMNAAPLAGIPGLARSAYGAVDSGFSALNRLGAEAPAPRPPAPASSRPFGTAPPVGQPDELGHPIDGGQPEGAHEARSSLMTRVLGEDTPQRNSATQGNKKMAADDYQLTKLPDGDPVGDRFRQQFQDEKNGLINHATQTVNAAEGADVGIRGTDEDVRMERGNNLQAAHDAIDNAAKAETTRLYGEAAQRATDSGVTMQQFPQLQQAIASPEVQNQALARGQGGALQGMQGQLQHMLETNGGRLDPNQVEQLRQSFNQMRTPDNAHFIDNATEALTQDVTNHAGQDFYHDARANHQMRMQTTGGEDMQDLFGRGSDGNRSTPLASLADAVTKLPAEQLNKLMSVWRSAANSDDAAVATAARQGLNDIQGHAANQILSKTVSTASANPRDLWNGSSVTQQLRNNQTRLRTIFDDKPEVLQRLQDLDDAGKIMSAPQSYPGASAQAALNAIRGGIGSRIAGTARAIGTGAGAMFGGGGGAVAGGAAGEALGNRLASGLARSNMERSFTEGAPAGERGPAPPSGAMPPWEPRSYRDRAQPQAPTPPAGGGAQAAVDAMRGGHALPETAARASNWGQDDERFNQMYKAADKAIKPSLVAGNRAVTAKGLLEQITRSTQDDALSLLGGKLLDRIGLNGDTQVMVHPQSAFRIGNELARGYYDRANNRIILGQGADARTAMHEIIHAGTSRYIAENPDADVTKQLKQLYGKVSERLKDDPNFKHVTDEHEFLAEAMTNPSFQRALGGMRVGNKNLGTVWNKVVSAVKDHLGLQNSAQTALDHAMRLHDIISQAPQAKLKSQNLPVTGNGKITINHTPDTDDYAGSHLAQDAVDSLKRGNYFRSTLADGTPIRIVHARQPEHDHLNSLTLITPDRDLPDIKARHIEQFGGHNNGDIIGRLYYANKDVNGRVGGTGLRHNPNITTNKGDTSGTDWNGKGVATRLYQEAEGQGGMIPYSSEPLQHGGRTEEGQRFREQTATGRGLGTQGAASGGTKARAENLNQPQSAADMHRWFEENRSDLNEAMIGRIGKNHGMSPADIKTAQDAYKSHYQAQEDGVPMPSDRGGRRGSDVGTGPPADRGGRGRSTASQDAMEAAYQARMSRSADDEIASLLGHKTPMEAARAKVQDADSAYSYLARYGDKMERAQITRMGTRYGLSINELEKLLGMRGK